MGRLWDRVSFGAEGPAVGRSGVAVAEVVGRLEAGEAWDAPTKSSGLDPADVVAALAADGLGDGEASGPSLVQSPPRRPKLQAALSEPALAAAGVGGDRASRLALAAGLLQIHDFWGPSHVAAQAADDLGERATSAYWHGVAHRREPDPGNAAYWFRRVGRHPIFEALAEDARSIVGAEPGAKDGLLSRFTSAWIPSNLIELSTGAQAGTRHEAIARRLQRAEMLRLLEASAGALGMS